MTKILIPVLLAFLTGCGHSSAKTPATETRQLSQAQPQSLSPSSPDLCKRTTSTEREHLRDQYATIGGEYFSHLIDPTGKVVYPVRIRITPSDYTLRGCLYPALIIDYTRLDVIQGEGIGDASAWLDFVPTTGAVRMATVGDGSAGQLTLNGFIVNGKLHGTVLRAGRVLGTVDAAVSTPR